MNSATKRQIVKTAKRLLRSATPIKIILRWTISSTGTYDDLREEYVEGTPTSMMLPNVPAIIKIIDASSIRYGRWGQAQEGDLIVGIDPDFNIADKTDLEVIYGQTCYRVIPNSELPTDSLSGMVGDITQFTILHCRLAGREQ